MTIDAVSGLFNQHQFKYGETITNTCKQLEEFAIANGVCLTIKAGINSLDSCDENEVPIIINIDDSEAHIKTMCSIDMSSEQSFNNGMNELRRIVYTQIVQINPAALPVVTEVLVAPK